jgi:hypothetical protein
VDGDEGHRLSRRRDHEDDREVYRGVDALTAVECAGDPAAGLELRGGEH